MAILIDISQIAAANVAMAQLKAKRERVVVDDFFTKHMIINSLRLYKVKLGREYGEMIICCDSKENWRKRYFPHYKANRYKQKEAGPMDWDMVYTSLNEMLAELKEHFPYRVIKVDGCEADDIIGILARNLPGQNVVVSGDKDFGQLVNEKVKQFHPITKKFIEIANPSLYLKELIIRGDKGDGVPNILSDGDTFVSENKRSKSIMEDKLAIWLNKEPKEFCENNKVLANYERNMNLIDLKYTPQIYQAAVMEEYKIPPKGNRQTVTTYFMNHRMRNLMESIGDF